VGPKIWTHYTTPAEWTWEGVTRPGR
jgi:hypothetical protein